MNTIPDCLRAWAPLIASGCQVPAASTIMYQAAELIEQQQAEIEQLKSRIVTPSLEIETICADEQRDGVLHNATPDCDGKIVSASGGGVHCTKCQGWFCY